MYVYKQTQKQDHDAVAMWTVGYYAPNGSFQPEDDYFSRTEAAERVHYLNGGERTAAL